MSTFVSSQDHYETDAQKILKRLAAPILHELGSTVESRLKDEAAAQKTLMQQYRLLAANGNEWLPNMRDVGFRKYSQFEEDGILLYIFSLISPINRTCVEICAGDGRKQKGATGKRYNR